MTGTTIQDAVTLTNDRDINLWHAASALHAACRAAAIALATADGPQAHFAREIVEAALERVSEWDDADGAAAAADPRPSTKAERC